MIGHVFSIFVQINFFLFTARFRFCWIKPWPADVTGSLLAPQRSGSYPTCLPVLVDPGHGPLGRVTSAPLTSTSWPLLLSPHCLLFPDRDGADCVSLTASAAPFPQGAPLTITRLSAPTSSLWHTNARKAEKERKWGEEGTLGGRSMEGRWLRRSRCPALINMVMSSAMTSHRKARGQPHRKWNLIETH